MNRALTKKLIAVQKNSKTAIIELLVEQAGQSLSE